MRCFTSCFGNGKHKKIIKPCIIRSNNNINTISPKTLQNLLKTHENGESSAVAIINAANEEAQHEDIANPINLIDESKFKNRNKEEEEELNRSSRKKVTFDDVNVSSIINEICNKENEKEKANVNEEEEEEEEESASSYISFPPSHRYHCCRNSDDEFEAIDLNDSSDVEDDDANNNNEKNDDDVEFSGNAMIEQEQSSESSLFSLSIDSRKRNPKPELGEKEVNSPLKLSTQSTNFSAKDRSQLSVLNPIQEKENINILKQSTKQTKLQEENQITVDTSLSSWLIESQDDDTPNSKNSVGDLVNNYSSTPPIRVEDRPVLVELKHTANSSSVRRSPSHSPNEKKPTIIGTVGSYLRLTGQATDSDSASSCKGISSNTTYALLTEDENNNSHSTPFQVRLERALDSGLAQA